MKKQAAIGFIFITLLIDTIGWGLIIPVMPQLIAGMKHIPVNQASKDGGLLLFVYAFMQFFCAPILGNLSDQYGRRPVILFRYSDLVSIIFFWVSHPVSDGYFWGEQFQELQVPVLRRLPHISRTSAMQKPVRRILE